ERTGTTSIVVLVRFDTRGITLDEVTGRLGGGPVQFGGRIDADGYRLGQGGGFYDRALRDIAEDTSVIAIVFEDEVVERVPRESHDHRVDVVVTPERVRWLSMPD
ncbi:MAG: 5-formyltetrahydrofolate cyclo-ligase, partial [Candidatus Nanopelagicales bacterium]